MKLHLPKMLLTAAIATAACFQQVQALTLTNNSALRTTEIDTSVDFDGTTALGVAVSFDSSVGYLSGWDAKNSLTLTLNKGWTADQHLIYATAQYTEANGDNPATIAPHGSYSFGFNAKANGSIKGAQANAADYGNTVIAADKITDTVTVTLEKDSKGTSMTDANGTSLYNQGALRYGQGNTSKLYINTALISSIALKEYTAATEFYASNAAGTWKKTFAVDTVAALTAGTANSGSKHEVKSGSTALGKGNIVVGGDTQLFLQLYENGQDLTVEDNIYIGQTSYNETNYAGVAIRFGNEQYTTGKEAEGTLQTHSYTTTINGNVYLVDNAAIKAVTGSNSRPININGTVTDVVDGVNTGSTLTVNGNGFTFNGTVNLTGLTLNSSVAFSGDVNVGTLTLASGVTMSSVNAITTSAVVTNGAATLNSDLSLIGTAETPLTLTLNGTMDLSGNDLALSNVTLGGSLLQSLLDGSATSITLFTNVGTFNGETSFDEAVPGYTVFTNAELKPGVGAYELAYTGGNITLTIVPEPATATLSLLALAGLAARRRRK